MQQHLGRISTADGSAIAYAAVGSGRPILYVNGWLSNLELSWELPEERAFYESLADGCRLLRFDRLGCGLSSRTAHAPSLASELDQVTAVATVLGDRPFDLVGASLGAPVAAAWASRHPESVRRLVLYGGWACGQRISPSSAREHILGLVESHWGLGSDVLTDIFAPDASAALRTSIGRYQRACSSAATARDLLQLSYDLDVGDALPGVRAPTLVVHRERDRAAPRGEAEALAADIPGAQLVVLPGRSHLPWIGDAASVIQPIRRFLGLRTSRRDASSLTARQREVAALISAGCTNREIAARLGIEERSVEGHAERIRMRLGFRSRAQIAAWHATQPTEGAN